MGTIISISLLPEGCYAYNVNFEDEHKVANVVGILHSILKEIEDKCVEKVDKEVKPLLFCRKSKFEKRAKEVYYNLTFKDF